MYLFATEHKNYEDLSSGRVLYGATGATNFPVRLASDIFLRCKTLLQKNGNDGPYSIYDPFCGAGYSLTVIGFLHSRDIKSLSGSDIDDNMAELAQKNVSLLTAAGLLKRKTELEQLYKDYKKESHHDALDSLNRLQQMRAKDIPAKIFRSNILEKQKTIIPQTSVDMVITDLPYGKLTQWGGAVYEANPIQTFLSAIKHCLKPNAIVAIVTTKKEAIQYDGFFKIKSFVVGKRKIYLLSQLP
jgi:23S rRNA G2445 N2-methylase RlmL